MRASLHVVHYTKLVRRRAYLEKRLPRLPLDVSFITQFDREAIPPDMYRFDEALFRRMLEPVRDLLIGYALGIDSRRSTPWAECVEAVRERRLSMREALRRWPWLRPRALSSAEVSVFLKHRAGWQAIAKGAHDWGIVAEDDILFDRATAAYFDTVVQSLPEDFDWVDLAGVSTLAPRAGNRRVNGRFYAIEPPRDRSCCCAIFSRRFARRLVELALPVCLPADWTLTYAFNRLAAKVYWTSPSVFRHGSEVRGRSATLPRKSA